MMHKVACAVCGKKGKVLITNGHIRSKDFYFFGRINLNSFEMSKYKYVCVFDKKGHFHGETVKEVNECYDPKAKKRMWDYWECSECYGRSD